MPHLILYGVLKQVCLWSPKLMLVCSHEFFVSLTTFLNNFLFENLFSRFEVRLGVLSFVAINEVDCKLWNRTAHLFPRVIIQFRTESQKLSELIFVDRLCMWFFDTFFDFFESYKCSRPCLATLLEKTEWLINVTWNCHQLLHMKRQHEFSFSSKEFLVLQTHAISRNLLLYRILSQQSLLWEQVRHWAWLAWISWLLSQTLDDSQSVLRQDLLGRRDRVLGLLFFFFHVLPFWLRRGWEGRFIFQLVKFDLLVKVLAFLLGRHFGQQLFSMIWQTCSCRVLILSIYRRFANHG